MTNMSAAWCLNKSQLTQYNNVRRDCIETMQAVNPHAHSQTTRPMFANHNNIQ